jgi:biopolymer transport protein TolR
MGMAMAGGAGAKSEINVTPLVDVLLVLLIIFMVITPLTPKGLDALVPQPPKDQKSEPTYRTVVVQVLHQSGNKPALKINQDDVTWENLEGRLADIYKTRAEKVMFIKGDDALSFSDVAQVIDIAHSADPAMKIGLITAKVEAGQ